MFLLQSNTPWQVADYWGHLLRSPGPALVSSLSTRYIIAFHWKCKQIWLIKKYSLKNKIFNYRNFYLLQPFPMYHISTTWMQVVPKLNPKGRDLLQVNIYFAILQLSCTGIFFRQLCFVYRQSVPYFELILFWESFVTKNFWQPIFKWQMLSIQNTVFDRLQLCMKIIITQNACMDKIELKTKHDRHVTNNAVFYPYEYIYAHWYVYMSVIFLISILICASVNACLSYFASLHTSATVDL